ncbi:MAG: EamA family transporter [Mycobacterium sp.]|nr:EamA family transporter [Mycobacterium sp.]
MSGTSGGLPPWSLAVVAMLSVQLGAALSVDLIATVGPAGTAWLRLTAGALIFLALARPRFRDIARRDYPALLALGVCTGVMSAAFMAAIERIPLGTAVAIEFLGPLLVAAVQSGTRRALLWPIMALLGVVLLTEPWQGTVNVVGIGFAVLSAVGWGGYIVLTQHVGDRFDGVTGLAVTIPVAALTTAAVGIPQASGHITVGVIVASIGLALLYPVVPFALEMLALGRMTHTAFGTLMALEPAIATALGLVVLHQKPSAVQLCGILLVVVSGAAAQRGGGRQRPAAVALPYPPQ